MGHEAWHEHQNQGNKKGREMEKNETETQRRKSAQKTIAGRRIELNIMPCATLQSIGNPHQQGRGKAHFEGHELPYKKVYFALQGK